MDLHIHTIASADYLEKDVTYLDILQQAELQGLDIIAFTDHNTVKGYADMYAEINGLAYLEKLGRAEPEESRRLAEYRRLLSKMLLLPGFEFTATFGFHILGIFPPDTPIRQLEHILLSLHVPIEALEEGSSNVGASADVLTCYRMIYEAGGLVIPAHVNSYHGIAMRGMDFGGQTRIAYTQDPYIHALEITDLEKRGRYTTARFFDGTKPGYPRRMRCIQGSDAHRLITGGNQKHREPGIGDRITEISLPEKTFAAIKAVFENRDFALTRPYQVSRVPYDHIQAAREEGETIVQSFHPVISRKGNQLDKIIADVCAFANTNGGTVYIGVSSNPKEKPVGVARVNSAIEPLYAAIDQRISPKLDVEIDTQSTQKAPIIRIQVARGEHVPYAIDDNKIYIRDEAETTLAVRDEIVRLVMSSTSNLPEVEESHPEPEPAIQHMIPEVENGEPIPPSVESQEIGPPLTGVEIVGTERRRGTQYHMMRDLRNSNLIHNVTRSSARHLWHYAIAQAEGKPFNENEVLWNGNIGLIRRYKKVGAVRYDLVQRVDDSNGKPRIRVYYGVTEDGMRGAWSTFISDEEIEEEA